jgi:O-acetylhomoserine (thiol)-lyase
MGYVVKLRNGLFRNTGGCLAPQNAFLNNLGIETLGLRMERHCKNALELAEFLNSLDADVEVNYPGLKTSPYYELAGRQFNGGYGAIVTLRVGSKDRAFRIINALEIPFILSNIGDTKTLVIHPASTIAVHLSKEDQIQSGVYDDMIRISVGIEDIEDLKQDFKNAIEGER